MNARHQRPGNRALDVAPPTLSAAFAAVPDPRGWASVALALAAIRAR